MLLKNIISNELCHYQGSQHIIGFGVLQLLVQMVNDSQQYLQKIHLVKDSDFNDFIANAEKADFKGVVIWRLMNNAIPHYVTLALDFSKSHEKYAVLLDAANCPEHSVDILVRLKYKVNQLAFVVGTAAFRKVQHDRNSCPLFSLSHAIELAKQEDFRPLFDAKAAPILCEDDFTRYAAAKTVDHEQAMGIEQAALFSSGSLVQKVQCLTWIEMPLAFVMHVQSITCMNAYAKVNPDGELLAKYVETHSVQNLIDRKLQNISIRRYAKDLHESLLNYMQLLNDNDILARAHVSRALWVELCELFNAIETTFAVTFRSEQLLKFYRTFVDKPVLASIKVAGKNLLLLNADENCYAKELISQLVQSGRIDLVNLLTMVNFGKLVASPVLFELFLDRVITEAEMSYVATVPNRLSRLNKSEVLAFVRTEKGAFAKLMKMKSFGNINELTKLFNSAVSAEASLPARQEPEELLDGCTLAF